VRSHDAAGAVEKRYNLVAHCCLDLARGGLAAAEEGFLTRLVRLAAPAPALLVALLVLVAACQPSGAASGGKPTVRVGSTNFTEQTILAELYAQALEASGYKVERRLNLGPREVVEPALESNQIDLYAEYMATLLAFMGKASGAASAPAASGDPAATASTLQSVLQPKGIAVLDYAPAVDTNGYVVTKATADRHRLTKVSDLAPVASQLVLGGPPECPDRPFCLPGLRDTYGLTFKDFKPLDAGGPLTVAALEGNQVDVGVIFTTDAVIPTRGLVLLADDKRLQLADNVVPVVRSDLLSKAPADFKTHINAGSAKLTTEELTGLNKAVGVDRKEPRDVAAAWLRDKGLVK
jgi:osmoprotectant transport system substrate-binding protein